MEYLIIMKYNTTSGKIVNKQFINSPQNALQIDEEYTARTHNNIQEETHLITYLTKHNISPKSEITDAFSSVSGSA